MKIDFISDIACPWCAVGLNSLERALETMSAEIAPELHFHPFELNPAMVPDGEDSAEHLRAKYGMSMEQLDKNRQDLRARGAAVGFQFGAMLRIWNTFDAHRLLYWAGLQSSQLQRKLKHALLNSYHGQGRNPADPALLEQLAEQVGLDRAGAHAVINSQRYADEVRAEEKKWQQAGINSVPSIVINEKYLITGGQSPDVFARILRDVAAETDPSSS
jgi:predicted DsbA family dithiol-disulfide isomerase